jgi:transcriptional adapter 2-alpha
MVPNNHGVPNALMSPDSAGTRPAGPATSSVVKATGYAVADLLSEVVRIFFFCHVCILKLYIASNFSFLKPPDVIFYQEKHLCCKLRLSPSMYLKMQEDMSVQMIARSVSSKFDVHQMFKNMDIMRKLTGCMICSLRRVLVPP